MRKGGKRERTCLFQHHAALGYDDGYVAVDVRFAISVKARATRELLYCRETTSEGGARAKTHGPIIEMATLAYLRLCSGLTPNTLPSPELPCGKPRPGG